MKNFFNKHWDMLAVLLWFLMIFVIAHLVSCSPTHDNNVVYKTSIKHKIKSVRRVETYAVWPIDPVYEVVLENGDSFKTTSRDVFYLDSIEYIYLTKDSIFIE